MMIHNMGVIANNLRTVVNLGVLFLTMCCHNFLTLLNIGSVNNDIIFFMTHFSFIFLWLLVTLFVWLAKALEIVMLWIMVFFMVSMTRLWYRSKDGYTGKQQSCTQFVHHFLYIFPTYSFEKELKQTAIDLEAKEAFIVISSI